MRRAVRAVMTVAVLWLLAAIVVTRLVPPPVGVGLSGPMRAAGPLTVLFDDSWLDADDRRQLEQSIFDALFTAIDRAERFIYLDLFLFNDWQGPVAETTRALSGELTEWLISATRRYPAPRVVLVTDPLNTLYGGVKSPHLEQLRQAGVDVVLTDLTQLQDSNIVWSSGWRWFIRPFGNRSGLDTVPNPIAPGRVSIRSWLALLNFKANHRKLAVFDDPDSGELAAMVMSANPHDGSSAHRNMAWHVRGPVVRDLLEAERKVPGLASVASALETVELMVDAAAQATEQTAEPVATLALANESAIRNTVLEATAALGPGDEINLEMFYLSDRRIIKALGAAAERGVAVRALLDVNSDAFGRAKNGIPNRPVAHELSQRGVDVRWCATSGEQCHVKWFHARTGDRHTVVAGSGNFTRRNLADMNLESDLVLRTRTGDRSLEKMLNRFETHWRNETDRTYSVPYPDFSDTSLWLTMQYRAMEATGLGTF